MKTLKILLIGQPNVGKSSLLNALVGPKVTVSNYPGTTVEITKAIKKFNQTNIEFEDTPGIYSVSDRSEEEKVTEKALFEKNIDGAIIIIDATSLERSLYITLQILEAGIPVIIAINFTEDAKKKGIEVNCQRLEKILHSQVVPINPLTKRGIDKLINKILKIKEITAKAFAIRYNQQIEELLKRILPQIKNAFLLKRFIGLRILEGDKDFYKYLPAKRQIFKERITKMAEDISMIRYATASFIAGKVRQIISFKQENKLQKKIDNILLSNKLGLIVTILFFLIIFGILLYLGNLIQGFLIGLTENFLFSFIAKGDSIISLVLTQGLIGVAAGISIALPYVFLFYLLLALLEDIGLLSRFIVNTERFLRRLGLSGKAFIPLAIGLGCTAPACRATRILSSKKEQFHTASLFAFVPCSSRIAIIMGVVGYFGGIKLALAVFASLLVAGLIWALAIKKIISIKSQPLLLELPPYRKPLIKNILVKSWIRMKDFVYIVIPFLALGGIIYGFLDKLDLTYTIVKPFSPITNWLGLPAVIIIPLIFGFLQKDLTGGMLISVLGTKIALALTPLQIYTFGLASCIGTPCIIALGMLIKEFGFKKATLLTITSIAYGFLFAGLIWRTISIF